MMKKILISLTLILLLVSFAAQVQAFDGDRKGFMLNLGAGFGQAEWEITGGGASLSVDETGFGGDFKLGAGINSQTVVYYTNRTLFYSIEEYNFVNGMSALGMSYFLEPQAPSIFFSAGVGLGVLMDSDASESESGMGFTFGLGFEFSTNWTLEATYMKANVLSEGDADLNISNLMISINWFAY